MNTHQNNNMKQDLIQFAKSSPMREVCGFVCKKGEKMFLQKAINHSSDDGFFLIKPIDFLERKLSGELIAIFHSHIDSDEKPSELDKKNSKNCLFPFLVFHMPLVRSQATRIYKKNFLNT